MPNLQFIGPLKSELYQLTEKIKYLDIFLDSPGTVAMPVEDLNLLKIQLNAMLLYSSTLEARLARWGVVT